MLSSFYSDKCTVLRASASGITLGTAISLSDVGASIFTATWPAPEPGALYALSGQQKATASSITLSIGVAINGTMSSLVTPPLAFNGSAQTFYAIAATTVIFNAADVITLVATPSAAVTLGFTVSASLIVKLGGQ